MSAPLMECHGHMMLGGDNYKSAVARHKNGVDEAALRENLSALRSQGVAYFRDGGDALDVSRRARDLAGEYGISYATPIFAIHRQGRYGAIVGEAYRDLGEYRALVARAKREGCDFIKLMLSGLVCFEEYGRLSCPPLPEDEIRDLIAVAHGEGFRVMAHANGADTVKAALLAGVDSVEHGYFMDAECLALLKARGAVWVPTFAPVSAFLGRNPGEDEVVARVLLAHGENLRAALTLGVLVATGSDAGAAGVPHGAGIQREIALLREAAGETLAGALDESVGRANGQIKKLFKKTA